MEKVIVALSGGVDSSVAAHLALEQNEIASDNSTYDVSSVTLGLWGGERESNSCSTADSSEAERVASHLGISHTFLDWSEQFNTQVVDDFVDNARLGITKNPCISCNKVFKAEKLFAWATTNGYSKVVTGHYARVIQTPWGRRVGRAVSIEKDQSYVLCGFEPEHIDMLELPLGEMPKSEVRATAENLGLFTANKPDSMGLCFSPRKVLATAALGDIKVVDPTQNKTFGEVPVGLTAVGQRRGLGVPGGGIPLYVVDITATEVVVGEANMLDRTETPVKFWRWVGGVNPGKDTVLRFQTAAHGSVAQGTFEENNNGCYVKWDATHRKVTPGQTVVAYATVDHNGEPIEVVVGYGQAA